MFKISEGINPMGLSASLADYKTKNYSQTWNFQQQL